VEWFVIGSLIGLFLITFLLGSIPWGVVISKLFFHKDIRNSGSGNIGTTNALRTLGKGAGAAVFVLDFGKGIASGAICLWASSWIANHDAVTLFGLQNALSIVNWDSFNLWIKPICMAVGFAGCTWGHIFSPWLGFKGGKGIAVAAGALFFVFGPVGGVLELVAFIIAVAITKYVSAGSLVAAVLCPILAIYFFWGYPFAWLIIFLVALSVIWAHRANIQRLRTHSENRLSFAKKAS
jgi:glycerol-3-phosphate acyltransferase PlsY